MTTREYIIHIHKKYKYLNNYEWHFRDTHTNMEIKLTCVGVFSRERLDPETYGMIKRIGQYNRVET
jgi:hypothetical protein